MNKIVKLDENLSKSIEQWDKYSGSKYNYEYNHILDALEAESIEKYLTRVKLSQSDLKDNERFSYVLINSENKILAFTFFYLQSRPDECYDMFIQSIVTNPKYMKQGYATELLATIFANPEKYIGTNPIDVGGFVFPWNKRSFAFFDRFAKFEKCFYKRKFYLIISDFKTIEQNSKQLLNIDEKNV